MSCFKFSRILSSSQPDLKISGVKKVVLAPKIPNKYGNFILADVGANIDIQSKHYVNIANLCMIYSQLINKDTIFKEVTNGPFKIQNTLKANWSPKEYQIQKIIDYNKKLKRAF